MCIAIGVNAGGGGAGGTRSRPLVWGFFLVVVVETVALWTAHDVQRVSAVVILLQLLSDLFRETFALYYEQLWQDAVLQ